ncbi:MAG: D-alanyl-D-alanine carboxypeptidase [Clostridia bacterium]|nr:D-alanyl-D-alanine carboxypeptidase [Clostridia bacterium]
MIKRTLFTFLCLLAFSIFPAKAGEIPQISAASAVLYDPLSGMVLYEKDAGTRRGMASTTKIMTALVALEQYDMTQTVEIKREWCGIEGSSMYLRAGERLTVSDLLYGLLLASGNDAATALAGMHPGGADAFVSQMNEKAAELSLTDTHFENPSGLDGESHFTTALELAKLTAEAMKNPAFARIVSTKAISVAGRALQNHNRLLTDIGACGVKTGYTKACGRCLVSAKEQNGRMLICVTLNAPNDWQDHTALYAYGFSLYRLYDVLGAGDCGSVPLISSTKNTARLYCAESASLWLTEAEAEQITTVLCGPRFWYGATHAGAPYGTIRIRLGREVLWEGPVYFADQSEEVQPETTGWNRFLNILFRSREH